MYYITDAYVITLQKYIQYKYRPLVRSSCPNGILPRHNGTWERTWKVLDKEDVWGINERAASVEELAERERLRTLGEIVEGGMAAAATVAAGEGTHTMSWIWYKTKVDGSDEEMVDGKFVIQLKT